MSDTSKQVGKRPICVNLDNQIASLPDRSLRSVLALFAHLENLATRELTKDAAPGEKPAFAPHAVVISHQGCQEGPKQGTCFRELGRQVLRTAKSQVRVLRKQTEDIQSLVLINNWGVAGGLWAELLFRCKTPLFELGLLEELWGISPNDLVVGGWSLTQHWHQFVLIQAEVEILLARRQSLVELSDILEAHLGHWLKRFSEILERLDEESVA
jgi:hypothetical protein